MKPHEAHRSHGPKRAAVVVVTVSSSRHKAKAAGEAYKDEAGDAAIAELRRIGHRVSGRELISDDARMIKDELGKFLRGDDDVLVFTGGTGVSTRDITIEVVRPFFEKELDGFGELVRRISYDKIGSAAILSRATAGVAKGKLIVCLPGSPDAASVGLRAFGREFPHALFVARS